MIEAKPYPEEDRRVAAVEATNLLDTPLDERFERITRMVCRTLDVPISLFNLLDKDRQHYKSVQGLNATNAPLKAAFCTHAIHEEAMLLVPDATLDERFHDNPFVTGEHLNVRFYAGCPIRTPDGMPVGTLCAIDMRPRDLSVEEIRVLKDLAGMIETELKLVSLSQSQAGLIEELHSARRLALIDPLTRLWNRSGIDNLIEKEWKEALRREKPLTIVMADIDHFKTINDTLGHPVGDEALRGVSKKLLECLRGEDIIGRVGGEEFLMCLNHCPPENMNETVERVRRTIEQEPWVFAGEPYKLTMSFGVVSAIPKQGMSVESFIKTADDALYQAKHNGRNRIETATDVLPA